MGSSIYVDIRNNKTVYIYTDAAIGGKVGLHRVLLLMEKREWLLYTHMVNLKGDT